MWVRSESCRSEPSGPGRRDGDAQAAELDRLPASTASTPSRMPVVVGGRQTEPRHRPVQPPQVAGHRERDASVDLGRLERAVPHRDAVVDGAHRAGAPGSTSTPSTQTLMCVMRHSLPCRGVPPRGQTHRARRLGSVSCHSPTASLAHVIPAPVPNRSTRLPAGSRVAQNVRMPTASTASSRSASTHPRRRSTGRAGPARGRRWRAGRCASAPAPTRAGSWPRAPPATVPARSGRRRRRRGAQTEVLLDAAQVVDLDGARPADVAEVVAHEVDDHDVLGVVLGQQRVGGARRALDRPRREPVATSHEVGLRRRAGDLEPGLGQVDRRGVRRRVAHGEARAERAEGPLGQVVLEHPAEVDLVDGARRDPRGSPRHPHVGRAVQARAPLPESTGQGASAAPATDDVPSRVTASIRTAVRWPSNVTTTTQNPLVRSAASWVTAETSRATSDPNLASDTPRIVGGGALTGSGRRVRAGQRGGADQQRCARRRTPPTPAA